MRVFSKKTIKTNADFILFAVKQARMAEKFGFTRNECCRNLKTALHQYWQNKTMGLHGQSRKHLIPRTESARNLHHNLCEVEHVVPLTIIVNNLMNRKQLTKRFIVNYLNTYYKVMLVTKKEHARLNASGLRSSMPDNWDGKDVFARYKFLNISL